MKQLLEHANGNGSIENRRDSRERILRAALSEFAEVGYDAARVDQIAERARINKAMLYYHFGTKDELYLESVRVHIERVIPKVWDNIRVAETLEEALLQLADGHLDLYRTAKEIIPIVLRESAKEDSKVMAMISGTFAKQGLQELMLTLITKEQERGRLRADIDPRMILMNFGLLSVSYYLIGYLWMESFQIEETPEFLQQRRNMIVDLYLNGLSRHGYQPGT